MLKQDYVPKDEKRAWLNDAELTIVIPWLAVDIGIFVAGIFIGLFFSVIFG
jgi:hypothetical protein